MNVTHVALIIIIQVCLGKDLDNLQFCERNIGNVVIFKLWLFCHGHLIYIYVITINSIVIILKPISRLGSYKSIKLKTKNKNKSHGCSFLKNKYIIIELNKQLKFSFSIELYLNSQNKISLQIQKPTNIGIYPWIFWG